MEKLFLQILEMSVTAGYCILVVFVLRLLIKRLPKLYSYLLWIVVYFRLICPVSMSSVFSLVRVQPQGISEKLGAQPHANISNGTEQAGHVVETVAGHAVKIPLDTGLAVSANPMQAIISMAAFIWIVVALLLILYNICSLIRLKIGLKRATLVSKEKNCTIYTADCIGTPFVVGLFCRRFISLPDSEKMKKAMYLHMRKHMSEEKIISSSSWPFS